MMDRHKVIGQLLKEDKFGLFEVLKRLNHTRYFYQYIESFKKTEIMERVMAEEENWHKLKELNTYKHCFK